MLKTSRIRSTENLKSREKVMFSVNFVLKYYILTQKWLYINNMCECHDRVFLILCNTGPRQISERHDRVFLLSVQELDIFLNAITGFS